MAVTVDKLPIELYTRYAQRTQLLEQAHKQYRFEEAASIPPQTKILNLYPQKSEMELLLGISPVSTPWAYFFPPKSFSYQRQSIFAFHRILPSLGSNERLQQDLQKIESIRCHKPEEKKEKAELVRCFESLHEINNWLQFIMGRIGQFLQG